MKIAVIGCGVMGSALGRHFSQKHSVILCDIGYERSAALAKELGAEVYSRQADAVQKAELIVLAVKPKDLSRVVDAIAQAVTAQKTILSVLAGVSIKILRSCFSDATLVRTMPNLAMTCGQGVIGVVDDPSLPPETREAVKALFEGLGLIAWLPEDKLDALTALTSSGPAFLFVLVEAMIDSGLLLGFGSHESREFVLKMMEGVVALLRASNLHPGELKWKVASPGGTTIAGLRGLEASGFRGIVMEAFAAACQRAQQMHHDLGS